MKFRLLNIVVFFANLVMMNVAFAENLIEAAVYANGTREKLLNNSKIVFSSGEDCNYFKRWGSNMFPNLKSGVLDGYFYTEISGILLAIPIDKSIQRWSFNGSNYKYVKYRPKGVVFPHKKFQAIEVKSADDNRIVYVADRFNYIGDTVKVKAGTRTLVFLEYKKSFYICQILDQHLKRSSANR